MKTFIFILLASFNSYATTFIVNHFEVAPQYEAKFIYTNSKAPGSSVELDCQSYFFKLDAFSSQGDQVMENFISYGECQYLWENFKGCIETVGSKCIDSTDIFATDCSCGLP